MRDTVLHLPNPVRAEPAPAPSPAVALARGAGIGPEISDAVLSVLEAAGARVAVAEVTLGDGESGEPVGDAALAEISRAGVLLKGPLPGGTGAALRKALGLHCTFRRARSFDPLLPAAHPGMDVVVIRETEEDLPGGPENLQTADVAHCIKRITRPGSERLCRLAFGFAEASGRKRLTCVTKANAMPITDGLFRTVFDETAADHPAVTADAMLIDQAAARLAARPERFDTLLAPNLYGDILSDVAAAVAGHPQLATSVRVGTVATVFEPIHGPAARLAGRNVANPSGLLLAACEMLGALGQTQVALRIENAWARTLEEGLLPSDLLGTAGHRRRLGTIAFARAVIERLGEQPRRMSLARPFALDLTPRTAFPSLAKPEPQGGRRLAGVDLTIAWSGEDAEGLAARLTTLTWGGLRLDHVANGEHPVWPPAAASAVGLVTGQWRCRFLTSTDRRLHESSDDTTRIADLLGRAAAAGIEIVKIETLYTYGGEPGYSPA
ncbi:MAG: isocitrate/isopropylmalate family dehydrogenase [Pseudomonadota bacterium]